MDQHIDLLWVEQIHWKWPYSFLAVHGAPKQIYILFSVVWILQFTTFSVLATSAYAPNLRNSSNGRSKKFLLSCFIIEHVRLKINFP